MQSASRRRVKSKRHAKGRRDEQLPLSVVAAAVNNAPAPPRRWCAVLLFCCSAQPSACRRA